MTPAQRLAEGHAHPVGFATSEYGLRPNDDIGVAAYGVAIGYGEFGLWPTSNQPMA
jgi:hypothetical protein